MNCIECRFLTTWMRLLKAATAKYEAEQKQIAEAHKGGHRAIRLGWISRCAN